MNKYIDQLDNIIKTDYDNINNNITENFVIDDNIVLHNIVFFSDIKKLIPKIHFKNFDYFIERIVTNNTFFNRIVNILIENLEIDNYFKKKILNDLDELYLHGFSFKSLNSQNNKIINLLEKDYEYLLNDKFKCKYMNSDDIYSPIIVKNNLKSCLHTGLLGILRYINCPEFLSYDAFLEINNKYTNLVVYSFPNFINKVYILADDNNNKVIDTSKLNMLYNLSFLSINSLSKLLNKQDNVKKLKIDLILYLSPAKKEFPQKGLTITENNVNSGDTTLFNYPLVRIFREEEMFKVLIHECIHAARLEIIFYKLKNQNMDKVNIISNNKLTDKLKFNEIITEVFAEIINCILYSIINKCNMKNVMNNELAFGFIQSAKIFNHFNFTSIGDFINDRNKDLKKIKQTTAAFEYHVLKTILFYKREEFFDIVIKKPLTQNVYLLINNVLLSKEYKKIVNYLINNLDKLDIHIEKSFRMTTTDILGDQIFCIFDEQNTEY